MEDSNATTIESLRGQLLSERSVSKIATQRVEELAKRVLELEEQLRVVTVQRKKAENTMTDVLISLKKNGFSYFLEAIHSGSDDNGINTESKISDNSGQEFCTSPGRSVVHRSCKFCLNNNGKTHGDCGNRRRRRRTSSTSSYETSKALGKSICRSEQGEKRAEVVEGVPNADLYHDGIDKNLEIALEEQARFIGRHEAEKKVHKERENFRGNTNCTLNSAGPGNLLDVKDEKDEVKGLTLQPAKKITSHDGVKPNGFRATTNNEAECVQPQQCCSPVSSESASEFPGFAISNQRSMEVNPYWKQKQKVLEHKSHHPLSKVLPCHCSAQNCSSHMQGNLSAEESSGSENKLQVKVLSEKANGLGSVLDALQSAKFSLSTKLSSWPREDERLGQALEQERPAPVPTIRAGNGIDTPVGYGRPHRKNMDLQPGAVQPQSNMWISRPGLRPTMYHPEMVVAVSAGNPSATSHWMEPRSRISTWRENSEPHLDTGRDSPSYGQYSHIPYVDLMQRMPSDNQISRTIQGNSVTRRSNTFYGHHSRSMMQE